MGAGRPRTVSGADSFTWMSPRFAFFLGVASFMVPAAVIIWQSRRPARSSRGDVIRLIATGALALLFFLAAPWAFLSSYLRFLLPAGVAYAAIRTLMRMRRQRQPDDRRVSHRLAEALTALVAGLLLYLDLVAIRGFFRPPRALGLDFPLRGGTYYVLQGGDSTVANPFHRGSPAERFAVDIVKLNCLGNRAQRFIPVNLSDYEIYGETI